MFQVFNAFQLVALFAGLPFLIGWLGKTPFPYAEAAFWTAICVYVLLFCTNVAAVTNFVTTFKW